MSDVLNSELYKRLKQYRVDFAYSTKLFFNAAERVSDEEKKKSWWKTFLEITSIGLSVLTLSSCAFYFSENNKELGIWIIGALSLLSVMISVWLLVYKVGNNAELYQKKANDYLSLYKQTKTIEAKVLDSLLDLESLGREIENLHNMQIQITNHQLITSPKDYLLAKQAIKEQESSYTDEEFKNT